MQKLKDQLLDIIENSFLDSDGNFEITNGQGGRVGVIGMNEVRYQINKCKSLTDLNTLVLKDWYMEDAYGDVREMVSDF